MIIAKITQDNLELTIQEINIPYQHSQGLEIEFIRDQKYKDYTLLSFYKLEGDIEAKLMECNNDIISIAKDVFKKIGKVSFSFSLTKDKEVIHLGVVGFYVRRAFGDNDSILPQEDKNTWIELISNVAKDGVDNYWNAFYKEEIENIVNDINSKVSAASNYASQANLAKTEAQKSATNAGNSATSALDSSNKAQQHLNSIVEKTNTFNADYASKVDDFNTSVEQANNTLDAKISTANTDIAKKVLDANNALDKKITDANSVIDAKVTEATTQANIATTKATELKSAVDKVNYLEDALDTKLTQPYVSNPVIENGTISDSDEGQLRNLRVYGKCTQKVEENIVPTPNREVPIVSKKINVNGETVELRSLKESVNLFDIKLYGFESGLLGGDGVLNPNFKSYASSGFIEVKPNTKYTSGTFNSGAIISSGIFFYNKNKEFISKTDSRPYVTPNECKYVRCGVTINGSTPINDLAIVNNGFVISEGVSSLPSYSSPTARDYKIVDHVNKRSYIERNVRVENLSNIRGDWWRYDNANSEVNTFHISITNRAFGNTIMSNKLKTINASWDSSEKYVISGHHNFNNVYINVDKSIDTVEKFLEWNMGEDIVIQYQLKTPITEEIPYLESDESEIGVSSQDTTSPSPNIKSPIETVDVLNIRACAKNMFNPQGLSGGEIVKFNGVDCYKYRDGSSNYIFDFSHNNIAKAFTFTTKIYRDDGSTSMTYMCFRYSDGTKTTMQIHNVGQVYTFTSNPSKVLKQIEGNYNYTKMCYIDLSVTQLEDGDTATTYESYRENGFSHELENPLVKCGEIADTIDLNNLERTNNNYYGLLDLANQGITYGGLVGNYRSCYWRANTMPKPKLLNNNFDKNNLICSRFVADLTRYNSNIGETISIYKDGSADFIATFNINRFKDVAEFKQFFVDNPTMVAYPLATPTTEPLEPELIEKLKTLMSFYPITHIISNAPLSFDYKLNLENWHKVVSGQVEDARDVIYNMQVQQNNLEVMQLESSLETQYNLDLIKLGGI